MSKLANRTRAIGLAVAIIVGASQRTAPANYLLPSGKTTSIKSPTGSARGRAHNVLDNFFNERSSDRENKEVLQNPPVRSAVQAIALFQHYWESIVLSGLRDGSQKKGLARTMSERMQKKNLSARLVSYREIHDRVKDTLTPSERETLVLYGVLADLDRGGECWVIESFTGCPCSEVAGYIDPKTGRLIFVWIMPEG